MDRLTKRDKKGRAYFDDDGALIRGANGAFRQKKYMTGQYIHQRFVALDKTIDRLAAYEDTGLGPEEIMSRMADVLREEKNKPLSVDELKEMGGNPYWYVGLQKNSEPPHWTILPEHVAKDLQNYRYGERWLAYRHKLEEGRADNEAN